MIGPMTFGSVTVKKNGSIEGATAFPLVSMSWKLVVPGVPVKLRLNVVFLNSALVPSSAFEALKMP